MIVQLSLDEAIEAAKSEMSFSQLVISQSLPRFAGDTFSEGRDGVRLNVQLHRVFDLMKDGTWRTLQQISQSTGYPEASISARLRDLRKPRYGANTVNRRHVERGLWEYQLVINPVSQQQLKSGGGGGLAEPDSRLSPF